jgi:ketosteroid isomerase-like protein
MPEAEEANKQAVRSFFETLSSGDLERLRGLFHEDATWTVVARNIAGAGAHEGRGAIIDEFLGPIRGLFEPGDPKVEIKNLIAEGSWVAVEGKGSGRLGDGTEYDNDYVFVLELEDGKVKTLREYMDTEYVSTLTPA